MAQPKKKLRVLIADDIQETRRNIRVMLSMNPNVSVVAAANDGDTAIELAREHQPDICIMDINMPHMDGLAAYEEIAKFLPETGCIIVSAEKHIAALGVAMAIGVQEYLVKPFTIDELNAAVDRVAANIEENRGQIAPALELHKKSEDYLKQLADEYAKMHRTDDQALDVFEQLAENPDCELRWLRVLAMLYIVRQEWGKLKTLAERLENHTGN